MTESSSITPAHVSYSVLRHHSVGIASPEKRWTQTQKLKTATWQQRFTSIQTECQGRSICFAKPHTAAYSCMFSGKPSFFASSDILERIPSTDLQYHQWMDIWDMGAAAARRYASTLGCGQTRQWHNMRTCNTQGSQTTPHSTCSRDLF